MLEKQTEKGVLKYRMPDILEVYDLLDVSSLADKGNLLKTKKKIIKEMGPMLDWSGIDGVNSYDDLIKDFDTFALVTSEIADEILVKIVSVFRKKIS
jgi:hypothetical protein